MKKICKSCGEQSHPKAKFCRYCGSSLLVPYEPPRSKGRAIGSFFIYFGIWVVAQTVVSYAFLIPVIVKFLSDPGVMRKGTLYIWELMMNEFMKYSTVISILSSSLFVVALAIIFTVKQNRRDRLGVVPKKNFFREVGFAKAPLSVCAVSVVVGAALNRIVTYIVDFIPWPDFFLSWFRQTYGPISDGGNSLYVVILCTVIMAPITEELLFRGIACSRFSPAFPRAAVVAFSALIFGIAHGTPIAMIYASAFGVVQAFVFLRHRSLYPVMLSHFAFNLTATVFDDACGVPTLDLFIFFACAAVSVAGIWFVTRKKKEVLPEAKEYYETV